MYTLYYFPGNASLLPHMMLREIGVAFELRLVDRRNNEQKGEAYLRLNPNGRIPVLIDGDLVLYETGAIALYLIERHPEAGLAPPPGSVARAHFYKWMMHLTNTPQAEFRTWYYPHEFVSDPAATESVKQAAAARLAAIFERIAAQLGNGPWLLGETFSAADLFLTMLTRWGRTLPAPSRTIPAIGAHAARVLARPAVQAAFEAEGIRPPFV
jgi:glutathione S-transferase